MTGQLLMRGMIVGIIAAFVAFAFARTFGEPQVDLAIAFEDQMNALAAPAADATAAPPAEEAPVVTRDTQAGLGLLIGILGYGMAIGGMFSLVFALAYGRLGTLGARGTSALLALAAFVATALVPQLKYPANPPAVGFDDTIAARTTLYFLLLAISIAAMVVMLVVARRLWDQRGGWAASITAGAVWVAIIVLAFIALPAINEMPEGFDPLVIWHFRVVSLGIHLILWLVVGLVFGAVAERFLESRPQRPMARVA